jgi:hypothetical protein
MPSRRLLANGSDHCFKVRADFPDPSHKAITGNVGLPSQIDMLFTKNRARLSLLTGSRYGSRNWDLKSIVTRRESRRLGMTGGGAA